MGFGGNNRKRNWVRSGRVGGFEGDERRDLEGWTGSRGIRAWREGKSGIPRHSEFANSSCVSSCWESRNIGSG